MVICGLCLAAVSAMLFVRLSAGGAEKKDVVRLLVELWAAFGLAAALLAALSQMTSAGEVSEVGSVAASLAEKFKQLERTSQILFAAGIAAVAGLFVHTMRSIRGAMRKYPVG